MITFNLQARNGNYYIGHEPSNNSGNCWGDEKDALVLTIDQARILAEACPSHMRIVISVKSEPMGRDEFLREAYCAMGGNWYHYPHRDRLAKMVKCDHHMRGQKCKLCGALAHDGGYWYDPITGVKIMGDLKL